MQPAPNKSSKTSPTHKSTDRSPPTIAHHGLLQHDQQLQNSSGLAHELPSDTGSERADSIGSNNDHAVATGKEVIPRQNLLDLPSGMF
jgi:hypothetical protein